MAYKIFNKKEKRYEGKVMANSYEIDAKNENEARNKMRELLKEDLNKNWFFEIKKVK